MEPKCVLVVCEDIVFYQAIRSRLHDNGVETVLALSPSEVLMKCISYNNCMIIIDWQKGSVYEPELLLMMQKIKYLPILVIIDENNEEKIISLYRAGATALLQKPVNIDICVAQAASLIRLYLYGTQNIMRNKEIAPQWMKTRRGIWYNRSARAGESMAGQRKETRL